MKYFLIILIFLSPALLRAQSLNIRFDYSDQLYISEFLAINGSILQDWEGDYSDWLEIHNPLPEKVNLKGWFLTDDSLNLNKWSFSKDILIAADEYLIVFASGKDSILDDEIHTNFKLSGDGEYLALLNSEGVIQYEITFGNLDEDISGGIYNSEFHLFTNPTPGAENLLTEEISTPDFSLASGFYNDTIQLGLMSDIQDAKIFYTLDNSLPTTGGGKLYSSPITIYTTTNVRAILLDSDGDSSASITASYFFIDSVLNQADTIPGYPDLWGPNAKIDGTAEADYEMDPDLCKDSVYRDEVKEALLSLPVLSIVTDINNLFSHDTNSETGGIYIYTGPPTGGLGKGWERQASVEYFYPDNTEGFKINCALKLHGGHSRLPEKSPKHSFRISFKKEYGPSRLNYPVFGDEAIDDFNVLVLKAGFNNTWIHSASNQRRIAQYIRDVWAKDTQLEMGYIEAHSTYVHLYLNGLYWGIYVISERIDDDFFETYFGGDKNDYDIIKDYTEVVEGNIDAWDEMLEVIRSEITADEKFFKLIGCNADGTANTSLEKLLNADNFIDYILINYYAGAHDWDDHNWVAARSREEGTEGFNFFCWDSEHILESLYYFSTLSILNEDCPTEIFSKLKESDEFLLLLAEHIEELYYNEGVLSSEKNTERWITRAEIVEKAIMAESARWGDYRVDNFVYSKENYWLPEKERLLEDYFPYRTSQSINELIDADLYLGIAAPEFSLSGGEVSRNTELEIDSDADFIIYTLDGTDPRALGGELSENAHIYYREIPLKLQKDVEVKARGLTMSGRWTTDSEEDFTVTDGFWDSMIAGSSEYGNFPNPFWYQTEFYFTLPAKADVYLSIYSTDGKKIRTENLGTRNQGENSYIFEAMNFPPGIFIYVLYSNNYSITGRFSHLK